MKRSSIVAALIGATLVAAAATSAHADSLSINFDSYSASTGADTRTPGGSSWWEPANAATSANVVNLGGNNVLNVYNNGNGNDGVIDNVHSPRLNTLAGETAPDAQPGATANQFTSTYKFRTVSSSAVAGFAFKSESWGQDRTTWLEFANDGKGNLIADYSGVTSSGTANSDVFTDNIPNVTLNWGEWYTVMTTINFVNPTDGSDSVTTTVLDASNNVVFTLTDRTWEDYYRYDSEQAANGNIVTGADSIQFQMRGATAGAANGVYVDDVTLSAQAVPLPAAVNMGLGTLGLAGAATLLRKKLRLA